MFFCYAGTHGLLKRSAIIRRVPGGTILYRMESDFLTSEGTFAGETDTNETGARGPGNNMLNNEAQVMQKKH